MPTKTINYGEIIKKIRKKYKMTQTELAQKLDIGKTSISNYETGYSTPSAHILESIAQIFNMTLVEFLTYENDEKLLSLKQPRIAQHVSDTFIPYLKSSSIRKDIIKSGTYMDSYLSLPTFMLNDTSNYICIKMPDNSMEGENIHKNDYLIIKKETICEPRSIVLVLDNANGTYLVRRYIRDEHTVSLVPSCETESFRIIRTDERDEEYTIVGYVEKVIVTLK